MAAVAVYLPLRLRLDLFVQYAYRYTRTFVAADGDLTKSESIFEFQPGHMHA
eukprot:COSAG02_NODE_154_length_33067_cov_38.282092_15_plen_52_part_00